MRFYCPLEVYEDSERNKKISESTKATWADPNSVYNTPEHRKKISASSKANWDDPEYRKKQIEDAKASWADPEYRKKQMKARDDPEFRKKMSASRSEGPYRITFDTGREIIIDSLARWTRENGYDQPILSKILHKKRGYTKHKDIVKVERLTDDPNEE